MIDVNSIVDMPILEYLNRWFDSHPLDKLEEAQRLADAEIWEQQIKLVLKEAFGDTASETLFP